ncbi:winged helix-turn-helix transcriptional regulator [Candidatus Pacearchaeota archaeon]|nr:winged helix-turn-helix transcriptional regulator [Candidatus Pacearchaeota archaeon]
MKKRERLEVIHDILLVINKESQIRPTKLLQKSNLSPQMFKEYITELIEKKLITKDEFEFSLTKKGQEFLTEYKTILNFIDNFGL